MSHPTSDWVGQVLAWAMDDIAALLRDKDLSDAEFRVRVDAVLRDADAQLGCAS